MRRLPPDTHDFKFRAIALMAGILILVGVYHHHAKRRRDLVRRTAIELKAEGERLVRLIHAGCYQSPRQLEFLFEESRRQSDLEIPWIQLRDQAGRIQARAGLPLQSEFNGKAAQSSVPDRQQLSLVNHPAGAVVIERFPVRWQVAASRPSLNSVANHATLATQGGVAVIEIAARSGQIRTGSRSRRRFKSVPRVDRAYALPRMRFNTLFGSVLYNQSNS
jgi:hypothetical protein